MTHTCVPECHRAAYYILVALAVSSCCAQALISLSEIIYLILRSVLILSWYSIHFRLTVAVQPYREEGDLLSVYSWASSPSLDICSSGNVSEAIRALG